MLPERPVLVTVPGLDVTAFRITGPTTPPPPPLTSGVGVLEGPQAALCVACESVSGEGKEKGESGRVGGGWLGAVHESRA